MAAWRQRFSREQVIEEVLVESEEAEEDEGPEVNVNDILETSIGNFTALRRPISNYTHFREEASQLMLNSFLPKVGVIGNRAPKSGKIAYRRLQNIIYINFRAFIFLGFFTLHQNFFNYLFAGETLSSGRHFFWVRPLVWPR